MSKKFIKAIAWDLDGTLIDFRIDFLTARKNVIKILKENGIDKNKLSRKDTILDNLKIAREIFKELGYSTHKIDRIVKEVNEAVNQVEHEAAIKATMINGIETVLEYANKIKLKQAIYTLNSNKNAKISLERVNLLHFFELIAGRDDVNNPKPHPDHLLKICDKLDVNPSNIMVIGDNARDIEGALNVNAHSIALNTRLAQRDTLKIADHVINETELPSKLIEVIKGYL